MSKAKKNKPVNAIPQRQKGYQLPTRVDDHMKALLDKEAKKERRRMSQIVEILLEEALRARGSWIDPPSESH